MKETFITPELATEMKQRWEDFLTASSRAEAAIKVGGMSSEAYTQADAEMGKAMRRIKEILGKTGKHWMA
jgi:Xaa-Pro aminopeptidase